MNGRSLLVVSAMLILNGCSSITGQNQQSVSVEANTEKGALSGALCELSNNKGKWFTTTPGSVVIGKSNENLSVICKKEGLEPGLATVVSQTGAGMAGNVGMALLVPIVGIIGAIVDHNSGAVYHYPTSLTITMGKNITIDTLTPKAQADAATTTTNNKNTDSS